MDVVIARTMLPPKMEPSTKSKPSASLSVAFFTQYKPSGKPGILSLMPKPPAKYHWRSLMP